MPDASEGCLLKLDRADEHCLALDKKISRYLASNPYRVRTYRDPESGNAVQEFRIREPPDSWAPLFGDCIHNLRAVLEYVAFALVTRYGTETDKIGFPICEKASRFKASYPDKIGQLRPGIHGRVKSDLRDMQPYRRDPKWPYGDPLWVLDRLDVLDKHHHILPTVVQPLLEISTSPPGTEVLYSRVDIRQQSARYRYQIIRVEIVSPSPDEPVQVNVKPLLQIVVPKVAVVRIKGQVGFVYSLPIAVRLPSFLWQMREAAWNAYMVFEDLLL